MKYAPPWLLMANQLEANKELMTMCLLAHYHVHELIDAKDFTQLSKIMLSIDATSNLATFVLRICEHRQKDIVGYELLRKKATLT